MSAKLTRQSAAAGLAATAQLGLPAGVATLGLQQHSLGPGRAAAIVLAALATIAISPVGVAMLARSTGRKATASPDTANAVSGSGRTSMP